MKIPIEIPRLEELQAEADKRGFIVEFLEPAVAEYHVLVSDKKGVRKTVGYVTVKRKGVGMNAGGWNEESGRLRIWLGKRVKVIGSLLGWMSKAEGDDDDWNRKRITGERKYEGRL